MVSVPGDTSTCTQSYLRDERKRQNKLHDFVHRRVLDLKRRKGRGLMQPLDPLDPESIRVDQLDLNSILTLLRLVD